MTDIVSIGLNVDSTSVGTGTSALKRLGNEARHTESATSQLTSGFKAMLGPLVAMASATAGLSKLVTSARAFDVMNASLVTVTGSTEKAAQAFESLQAFAASTPFSLEEVTQAFVKMNALGLDPSKAALTSYGNTASAMGKSLNQMIEAVADAATGEFERLKEFGIKARQNGDEVALTFQGVTTKIGNNAGAIEQYLQKIGNVQFAGAMEQRANSLDGALSNLADSWDGLFRSISKSGAGDLIASGVKEALRIIEKLDIFFASGAFQKHLNAIGYQLRGFGDDISSLWKSISSSFSVEDSTMKFLKEAFINFPANVRTAIQLGAVELAAFVQKINVFADVVAEEIENIFTWGKKIETASLAARMKPLEEARDLSIAQILEERQAIIDKSEADRISADHAMVNEEKRRAARTGDLPTGDNGATGGGGTGKSAKEQKEIDELARSVERIRQAHLTEGELLFEKLANEQAIIDEAHDLGKSSDEKYLEDKANLNEYYDKRTLEFKTKTAAQVQSVEQTAFNQGIALLQLFAGKNKEVAAVLIGIQTWKAVKDIQIQATAAAAQVIAYGQVEAAAHAAMFNYPMAAAAVARSVAAAAAIGTAATIGTGLAIAVGAVQLAQLSGGSNAAGSSSSPSGATHGGYLPGTTVGNVDNPTAQAAPTQARELRVTIDSDGPHSEGMRAFARNLAETIKDMGGTDNLVIS